MQKKKFPRGWDKERIQRVIAHYEKQTEEEAASEDEAAFENQTQTMTEIPKELIPAIQE